MASKGKWDTRPIGDLLETIIDYRGKTPPKSSSGIPLISAANVKAGRVVMDNPEFISPSDYDKWTTRGFTKYGDVLITTEAPAGEVAPYPRTGTYQISRRVMAMRPRRAELNSGFLLYALQWSEVKQRLLALSRGTTVPRVLKTDITGLEIPYPPLPEQKAISHILGSLDDKIELNRRMNDTLEAMARTIFVDWYARSVDDIELPSVQELIDEGTLQIGDGYRAKRIELDDDGLPFVRAKNLQNTGFELESAERLGSASLPRVGEKVCLPGDVAFTSKGTVGRMTQVTAKTPEFVYSPQVCYWRVVERGRLDNHVLFRWMQSTEFHRQVAAVKGQTDMAEYVSLQDQRRMRLSLPGIVRQKEIASQLAAIDEQIAANFVESRTLSDIRDALLPKLLSGTLAVAYARRTVEAAL